MAQKDRLEHIKQVIQLEKKISVASLSGEFQVSPETIRRDLARLEADGIVTRTHGGAILNEARVIENSSFLLRASHHKQEKTIIARLVCDLIPKRCVIAADASSTVVEAVSFLSNEPNITVLTHSTQIINESFDASFRVVSTGGTVNKSTFSMQGSIVRNVLKSFYVDVVLLSCKALNLTGGIFDSNEDEAEIKKLMVERGQKIILLADHSKFDKVAFVKLMDFEKLDALVTDREPSQEWKDALRNKNVALVC
ncbi:MAG: DeoR/GlpR transcriptional regulator [Synergistaceae bacterium]|nr:DeoR/GlpR transcriptional regulator [Synergistaceae bacterium]